jgi:1-deoxy-D-xylulose-5-phosphate reductoisomerase
VQYCDGSVLAEMANPDMRVPIAYGLSFPNRIRNGVKPLDLRAQHLEFEDLDVKRFPCLTLAYECLSGGVLSSTILNAANEVAVAAFLEGHVKFTQIYGIVAETLEKLPGSSAHNEVDLETILAYDERARNLAHDYLNRLN